MLSILAIVGGVRAQSFVSLFHPYPGVCDGYIHVDTLGWGVDSVAWSTGEDGFSLYGLSAGIYGYDAYSQGDLLFSGEAELVNNGWHFMDGGLGIPGPPGSDAEGTIPWIIQAAIGYCGTSMWNFPCCGPHGVFQWIVDGVELEPDIEEILCFGGPGPSILTLGHEWCVRLIDTSCGVTLDGPCVITHNCANLQMDTVVTGSVPGEATGSVQVLDLIPDTTEVYPIYSPVTGLFDLVRMSDYTSMVPAPQTGGAAQWMELDTGRYLLWFIPDAGCQIRIDTVYVPPLIGLGQDGTTAEAGLSLVSNSVTTSLEFRSIDPTVSMFVRVVDMTGRSLIERRVHDGRLYVDHLPSGSYGLNVQQGERHLRTRFLKR